MDNVLLSGQLGEAPLEAALRELRQHAVQVMRGAGRQLG